MGTRQPQLPRLTAAQARAATTIVMFLDAYNAGQVDAALALLTDDAILSDCDYAAGQTITRRGQDDMRGWLRERTADHDRLVLDDLYFGTPNEQTGAFAVAVSYTRRTSNTLRSLGLADGIDPHLATKAIVTKDGGRLLGFNNGPYGGPQDACRPLPRT